MKKSAAIAGLAAMTLLDISAATPAAAQNITNPFDGFYAGAHLGYGSASSVRFTGNPYTVDLPSDTDIPVSGRNDKFNLDGILGGAHTGYNVVTPGNFLFGIEGDWTYLGIKDTVNGSETIDFASDGYTFQHRSELELEWQGTIRGRLGFVSGNTLFFTTAGVAFLNVDWNETAIATDDSAGQSFTQNHGDSDTLTGVVLGGGVEVAVTPTVIFGADYLYENFGSIGSVPFGHTNPGQTGRLGDIDVHKVRARVSIKFGGGTP